MNNLINNLIEGTVQCYGCPIFDRLFRIVSEAAAAMYNRMAFFAVIIFCILFAFFVLNAVWQNIKKGNADPWYNKSVRPVIINSLVAMSFLWVGVALPRMITTATFEPVAQISLSYTQTLLNLDDNVINEHVTYQPLPMSDDGFFRPQLRDKIVMLMKTTITQFQGYMKLGIAIMDTAFSWRALLGIGAIIRHFILFMVGIYIFWAFFKLFFKFCCYFADIIIAMALFAFFFPLSLVLLAFGGAEHVPSWMSGLGKKLGVGQFKTLINAIVALAAAVITYTVIMVIIAQFFSSSETSVSDIVNAITSEQRSIFDVDLSEDNFASLTIMGTVVLVYVINFLKDQIPKVTSMILSAFDLKEENQLSEELGNNAMQLTSAAFNKIKEVGKTIISGGEATGGQ